MTPNKIYFYHLSTLLDNILINIQIQDHGIFISGAKGIEMEIQVNKYNFHIFWLTIGYRCQLTFH